MHVKLIPIHHKLEEDMLPEYGTSESACFDIKADIANRKIKVKSQNNISVDRNPSTMFRLFPGERALIPTGYS